MAEVLIQRTIPEKRDEDDADVGFIYDDVAGQVIGFYGHNNTDDTVNVSYQLGALTERMSLPPHTSSRQRVDLQPSRRIACRLATIADHPWQQRSGFVFGGALTVEREYTTRRRASPTIASVAITEFLASATTAHDVPNPSTLVAGDGIAVFFLISTASDCSASGFAKRADITHTERSFLFGRVAVGTEDGANVDFLTPTASLAVAHSYRIDAGTWAEVLDGFVAASAAGTSSTPDPPNVSLSASNDTMVLAYAAYGGGAQTVDSAPTDYTNFTVDSGSLSGTARRSVTGSSENPGTFGGSGSAAWGAITLIILSDTWDFGAIPYYVGPGNVFSGIGAPSGVLPGGIVSGDILLWEMETEGEDANAEPIPDSWTALNPVASATGGAADATRLTVAWIEYTGSAPDLTSTDPGNHHVGVIHAFRNVDTTTPIHVQQTSSDGTNDTAMSITGVTTTLDNCLIVYMESNGDDNGVGGPVGWSSVADASLDFLKVGGQGGTTSGSDGSIGLWYGGLAAQGASGTLTGTIGASEESASICFALAPASALSTVGKDNVLRWDVRAAVGDSSVLRWDVKDAIGDEAALEWNVFIVGGDQVELQWDVRAVVGDTAQLVWDVIFALGEALDIRWDVRDAVFDEVGLEWDVFITGGDEISLLWDVRAAIGDEVELVWDVIFALGDTVQLIWDVRDAVSDEVELLWDVFIVGGDEVGLIWDIRGAIGDLIQTIWDVFALGGDEVSLLWDVFSTAGDSAQLVWDVRVLAGENAQLIWDVFEAVGDSADLIWDVRGAVGEEVLVLWDISAAVGDEINLLWDVEVIGAVGDVISLRWDVLEAVDDSIALEWDILDAVGDEVVVRWDVLDAIGEEVNLLWDLRFAVSDQATLQWDVLAAIGEEIEFLWDVLIVTGVVGDNLQLIWDVLVIIGDNLSLVWDVLAPGVVIDEIGEHRTYRVRVVRRSTDLSRALSDGERTYIPSQ